jgi:hypothetical protein
MAEGKELEQLVVGVMELAVLLADRFKDGVQVEDALVIFAKLQSDPVFKDALVGLGNLPEEVKELEPKDYVEISIKVLQYIPVFIEMFSKKK